MHTVHECVHDDDDDEHSTNISCQQAAAAAAAVEASSNTWIIMTNVCKIFNNMRFLNVKYVYNWVQNALKKDLANERLCLQMNFRIFIVGL